MKKLYFFLSIGISLLFLEGCKKLDLDLVPESSVTDAVYWRTPAHFESFMTGIHSRLRDHTYNLFQLGGLRADEFDNESFGGLSSSGLDRLWLNTINSEFAGVPSFGGFYTNINQLNLFIERALSTDVLSEADKDYFLGQAYGLRAYYYFHLLRSWGNVVIVKEPSTSFALDKLEKPSSPSSEVMELIKSDIDSSTSHYADNYSFRSNQKSVWSKPATLMLKAEVYLWSARQMEGGSADAGVVKAALTEIQTNVPELSLLGNFKDVFAYENKNNNEIIFAIRHELNEAEFFINPNYLWTFIAPYPRLINHYDSVENRLIDFDTDYTGQPAGGMGASVRKALFWSFPDQDIRKSVSMKGAYSLENGNYYLDGVYLTKYPYILNAGLKLLLADYPIYRYADLLLMLAEAKAMLGEDPALEINLVRQRAYGTNYQELVHGYPNQPGDDDINEVLLKERLFEFFGEGKRWYDLRRFGKNYVFKYTSASQDYQLL